MSYTYTHTYTDTYIQFSKNALQKSKGFWVLVLANFDSFAITY